MPKITYISKNFQGSSLEIIKHANVIIESYAEKGFDLTLRQIYYQFVARDLIPNKQKEYKRLGNILNDARLAGMIDWDHMVDRTRNLLRRSHWDSPEDIIDTVANQYHIDHWIPQPVRVEVWIEKDALIGILKRPCNELDVPYFSCRGYVSQSEMWNSAQRIINNCNSSDWSDQKTIILHLGDHDPSGIDMTRDIQDRLNLFCDGYCDLPEVKRIALNMNQIREINPPPNFAKISDSRYEEYVKEYGKDSWELDALPPEYIEDLITTQVENHIYDTDEWKNSLEHVETSRKLLSEISNNYDKVVSYLQNGSE